MKIEERKSIARLVNQISDSNQEDLDDLVDHIKLELVDILERTEVPDKRVNVHELGAHARVKFTRGKDVRHQDEWTLEVHSETTSQAKADMNELIDQYESAWGQRVADLNPER